jgi:hypothetical protein
MLFTPDVPEWLVTSIIILLFGLIMGLFFWGSILGIQYISPFTLIKTSGKDKWRKASIVALMQTSWMPIMGLLIPFPKQDWRYFQLWISLWVIILPIAILFKRWEFERRIKYYRRVDRMIKAKDNVYQRFFTSSFTMSFMSSEQKRFFSEGFPDSIEDKQDGVSSEQE